MLVDREGILRRAIRQEARDARGVEIVGHKPRGQHALHLAGKHDGFAHAGHVERFDAELITGEQHPLGVGMVEGEGKHAVELVDGLLAPGR